MLQSICSFENNSGKILRGRLAKIAGQAIVINETHYGRAEDAHMGICHMICYSFMENPGQGH